VSDWLKDLYREVDAMDAEGFADVFLPDGVFQWANAEPLRGPAPIEQTIAGFFGTIAGLRHEFVNVVEHGEHVVFEARVTYTRKDGRTCRSTPARRSAGTGTRPPTVPCTWTSRPSTR